ncbi:MAG: flagellar cap protein [Carnobacterium sp.]|nr:flagellar cap protein [Carnobacterium sp.]
MTTTKEWNQLRSNLLEIIWQLITSWDGTLEHALIITETNQENIAKWQKLMEQVANETFLPYTDSEIEKQKEATVIQERIIATITSERSVVVSQLKQINKKNKVRDNYVSAKRDPFFIDKGL